MYRSSGLSAIGRTAEDMFGQPAWASVSPMSIRRSTWRVLASTIWNLRSPLVSSSSGSSSGV
jgi:hypothetical protein